ncbi:MAG: glycosyltransferase [Actinomycetota bacterium]|nr:glycosyltransferase [Actinomycetota bacterium]
MTPDPGPVWVAEVQLGRSLLPEGICRAHQVDDVATRVLVRRGRRVVGFVTLTSTGADLDDRGIGAAIARALGDAVMAATDDHEPATTEPITVVVCTRDRPEMLAACLKTLQQLRYRRYEVVVVDNASCTDASRDCFERLAGTDARFRYVREPVPGLSRARNRGMAEATTRYVAFTDDDTLVDPWWLDGIADGFARAPLTGCVTGLVPPAQLDFPAQRYFDRRFSWGSRMEPEVYRVTDDRDPSTLYPYSAGLFGTGANFAVDRRLLVDLGGFDEALGAGSPAGGGEELDVFVRVLRAGRPLVYQPSAIVWHVHRGEPRASRQQLFSYGVGLTAFLTKYLLDARTSREVLTRIRPGARRMWGLWRAAAVDGRAPVRLVLTEATGMAVGPVAYLRGRHRLRRGGRA